MDKQQPQQIKQQRPAARYNEAQRAARKILALTISEPLRREVEQANRVHIPEGSTLLQALQIIHGGEIATGPSFDDGGGIT